MFKKGLIDDQNKSSEKNTAIKMQHQHEEELVDCNSCDVYLECRHCNLLSNQSKNAYLSNYSSNLINQQSGRFVQSNNTNLNDQQKVIDR